MTEVTRLLSRINDGDDRAADDLLPIVYTELRRLAGHRIGNEGSEQTLYPTELVHESYLRLVGTDQSWKNKAHFFAAAAEAMRRILVDRARSRKRVKRGGRLNRINMHDSAVQFEQEAAAAEEVIMVNDLLDRLADKHPKEAEIVKLRYFADFSVKEAANILQIPVSTAYHRWNFAQAWLRCEYEMDDQRNRDERPGSC